VGRFEQRIPEETIDAVAERHAKGESIRSLAREIGMDSGGLSRRLKRRRERLAEERNERRRATQARRNRREWAQRAGREPAEHAFESLAEMRELAAQADADVPDEAKIVAPLKPGETDSTPGHLGLAGSELPDGEVSVIWDYPTKGQVVLAVNYDALYKICRSDIRVHWFVNAALTAGELLPGELDHRRPGSPPNLQRRVRFSDGSRQRAYCFIGSHERMHLVRLYRALLFDSRDPANTGIHPPPPDEHGRILGVYRV
jgi:hypothetical protein